MFGELMVQSFILWVVIELLIWKILLSWTWFLVIGDGFKRCSYFLPQMFGEMIQFDEHIFSDGFLVSKGLGSTKTCIRSSSSNSHRISRNVVLLIPPIYYKIKGQGRVYP